MTLLEFMSKNPITTILILCLAASFILDVLKIIFWKDD